MIAASCSAEAFDHPAPRVGGDRLRDVEQAFVDGDSDEDRHEALLLRGNVLQQRSSSRRAVDEVVPEDRGIGPQRPVGLGNDASVLNDQEAGRLLTLRIAGRFSEGSSVPAGGIGGGQAGRRILNGDRRSHSCRGHQDRRGQRNGPHHHPSVVTGLGV